MARTQLQRCLHRTVSKPPQSPWVATTDMMIERLQACKAAGADYFIVKMPNAAYNHEEVLRFNEEVIPALS